MYLLPSLPLSRSVQAWHVSGVSLHPLPRAPLTPQSSALPLAKQPTLPPGTECGLWGPRWTLPSPHWNPQICGHKTEAGAGPLVSAPGHVGETQGGAGGEPVYRGVEALEREEMGGQVRGQRPREGEGQSPSRRGDRGQRAGTKAELPAPSPFTAYPLSPTPATSPAALCLPGCPPPCPQPVHCPGKGLVQAPSRPWVASGLWVGRSWGAPLPPPAF